MARTADVLVIGGGAFGLWAARACAGAGLRVILAEAERIGAGASGGPVGALMPHRPEPWHALNRYQLAALATLPDRIAALGAETGRDCGYVRSGRLSPLRDRDQRARDEAQAAAARRHWGAAGRLEVLDSPPQSAAGWLDPAACAHGVLCDTLTARVEPRRYLAALRASLAGRAEIREGWRCHGIEPTRGTAIFDRGEIAAAHLVLAAGSGSFPLIRRLTGHAGGTAVKGQAALLGAGAPEGLPVIQDGGLYVVAHAGGVAVGSTTETGWQEPGPDRLLDRVVERARALCPALAAAPVIGRWSGLRPKAGGGRPLIGRLPGCGGIILATGGYRIGLGIAHLAGEAVAALVRGEEARLPAEFAPERLLPAPRAGETQFRQS